MPVDRLFTGPEDLSCQTLTEVLRRTAAIRNAAVTKLNYEPVGQGLLGEIFRFSIGYDHHEDGAPATLIGKFAPTDASRRESGAQMGVYLTETRFYQAIASTLPVRAPKCYAAAIDERTHAFGLLMEDASPARQGDQLAGCSKADAEHAMRQAAAIHAPYFCRPAIRDIGWMKSRQKVYGTVCAQFDEYVRAFKERYDGRLSAEYWKVIDDFAPLAAEFALKSTSRFSLVHSDYRLDNLLFDLRGGEEPVIVFDWQGLAAENPGIDVAYFMGSSYPVDRRASDERDLLHCYHDELRSLGLHDYKLADIFTDYRRGAWQGLMTAIFASAVAKRSEHGEKLFLRMASGAAAQMLDLDTLSFA